MAESYSVEAYLKATGASQFAKAFGNATKNVESLNRTSSRASISIGTMIKAIAGSTAVVGAFRAITSSIDGAISRFDTLNNFPRVMQLMGFSAGESERAISRLSDGIEGLPTTLDSVASTTQRLATMTGDLDGAVETTLALNNAFLASGSSAADAQRGLEQYIQMLSTGKVDMQSWQTLQETMPIALNKTAEAFGFTGRSAQNDLYEALKEGEITFDDFNAKLIQLSNATGGFADMARESSTGIATSWQNVRTAIVKGLADMIASIDESLASFGGISGVLDSLKVGIQTAFSWINQNLPIAIEFFREVYNTIKPWIPLVASIVAAFLTFNTVVNVINGVKNAVTTLRTGIALLNATMLANPIALIVALLAGLAVMFIHLWNTSETFRNTVTELFNTFLSFVMPIVQTVVNFIMQLWGQLVSWWGENNQMILQAAQNVWNVISTVITTVMNVIWGIMQALWPVIQFLIVDTWNAIKGVIQGAIDVITGIIDFFTALFTGNWSAMWDAVKQIVSGAVKLVWNLIQLWFVGKILKAGKALFSGLRSIVTTIWNTIKSLFTNGVNTARNLVSTGFNFIRNIISSIMSGVRSIISNIWNGIRGTVSNVVNAIRNTIRNVFNTFRSIVSNAFNGVKNAVRNGIRGALNIIKNMFSNFKNAGKNIVTSIANGIKGAIGAVTDAIGGVVSKVRNFLPFSPAKEGPLTDIHRLDFGIIGQGIQKATPKIQKMMTEMLTLPEIDIAGEINRIHAHSNRQMSYSYQNELTVNKQPAYINLILGGQEFNAFVDDITTVQDRKIRVRKSFQ